MSKPRIISRESTGRKIIEQSRVRLTCVGLFFLLCFVSISWRMVEVAVLSRHAPTVTVTDPDSGEKSEQVPLQPETAALQRGDIVDRNGVLVATSLMTASVFVNPKELRNPEEAAEKIGRALVMDDKQLLKRFSSDKSFIWVKRNLTPKEEQAVNSLGLPGLYFVPEERRVYPYGNLLSHVVGYVGIDDKGLAGIEKQFDQRLRDPGKTHDPLKLSLDVRLQAVLREETEKAVDEFRAIGATGIIMDVRSGEVLSMISLPDFDPNRPGKSADIARFNRASLGAYEMGSTFKSFTMAAAFEYGTANMKSKFDATNPIKVSSFTIDDSHPLHRWLTVPEIYAFSSNIGTARMIEEVGTKRQKEFLSKMGMLKPVEIELPEKASPLYPSDWKEINTVTIAYGHGISVSPLHLVRGIAGLVTGTLPRLTLIKDSNQNRATAERAVTDQTAKNIRRLMRLVVDHGTGSRADVPGYRVAGKTGTAEKATGGGYSANAKLASFISVFPADDPRYLVLVMIDEPKGDQSTSEQATGGWIAAPVVSRVIARMGPMLGLKPDYNVPADDAEKFWVGNDKPKTAPPPVIKKYLHVASY